MNDDRFDFAVVGAGPAGVLHGVRLAARGGRVVVVGSHRRAQPGTFELLSSTTAPALDELALLPAIRRRAPRCTGTVFRWADRRFRQQSGAGWNGGWVIDRNWLDPMLREHAASAGVTLVAARVSALLRVGTECRLRCHMPGGGEPMTLRAGRLALANGRGGRLAAKCGLSRRDLRTMVSINTSQAGPFPQLGPRLLVDAADNGWWYAMGDGRTATIGYVTDVDQLAAGPDRLAATWTAAAQRAGWLPEWARSAELRGRPAGAQATDPAGERVVVIGDAALALDPLSGHGLSLAIAGAFHSADEPESYRQWVADQRHQHDQGERTLYSAARHPVGAPFWARRVTR